MARTIQDALTGSAAGSSMYAVDGFPALTDADSSSEKDTPVSGAMPCAGRPRADLRARLRPSVSAGP